MTVLIPKILVFAGSTRVGAYSGKVADCAQLELALQGAEVLAVHDLRTRASGPFIHIQFHADLDPDLPLRRAPGIIVRAEERIRAEFPAADIIIHPDPMDNAEPHGHEYFAEGHAASSR